MGAAIYCFGCRAIDIQDSVFKKLKSQLGGAIHIVDFPNNKLTTDNLEKYSIVRTTFDTITAHLGGALYLDHPQLIKIQDCKFNNLKAINVTN
jgi:hypothetical protein